MRWRNWGFRRQSLAFHTPQSQEQQEQSYDRREKFPFNGSLSFHGAVRRDCTRSTVGQSIIPRLPFSLKRGFTVSIVSITTLAIPLYFSFYQRMKNRTGDFLPACERSHKVQLRRAVQYACCALSLTYVSSR